MAWTEKFIELEIKTFNKKVLEQMLEQAALVFDKNEKLLFMSR